MQQEFDFTGAQLRDAGMQLAIEHANSIEPKWSDRAYAMLVEEYFPACGRFMTEDFRLFCRDKHLTTPPSDRAFGWIIRKAAREGIIEKVGYAQVSNPKAHKANAAVWRRVR